MRELLFGFILVLRVLWAIDGKVIVGVTIHSYVNVNGTAYVEMSNDRTCCDGPQRQSCVTGDTCDTFFDICIGRMEGTKGCTGAFMKTMPLKDTNNITNVPEMKATSDFWGPGMTIFVFIRDDDSSAGIESHDHIDSLFDQLSFNPDSEELTAQVHDYQWEGKTQLSLSIKAWCAPQYYDDTCDTFCQGVQQIAICDSQGQLTCQYSDEILLEFINSTTRDQSADLARDINSYVANEVCTVAGASEVDYPTLDIPSNTLSFTAFCSSHQITALEFESLLQLETDNTLNAYFPPGIRRGLVTSPKNYGEHIIPNVYLGITIKSLAHHLGTSFNGDKVTGERRCCDVPKNINCGLVADKCDMKLSICIGKIVQGACVGAYVSSRTFDNTTSLTVCGPTLLDNTTGTTFISRALIGAMRFTQNSTSIDITVQDIDMDGLSFDVIDHIAQNVTLQPGANVTAAHEVDIVLKNVVTLKLGILAWCAPGHSGPDCSPDNGTDTCVLGWYGPDCSQQIDLCHPNPCWNGHCSVVNGTANCTCPPGLTGPTCMVDVNECDMHVCQNNATCENKIGYFICNCAPGWDGLICTEKSPGCDQSPCVNGKCTPGVNSSYTCTCDRGWVGKNCDEKFICNKTSCAHGDCLVLNDEYFCVCFDGFKGVNCSEDKDECKDNPCLHAGTCINTVGSFSCVCPYGYSGKICANATNVCPPDYCLNGGTCLDDLKSDEFKCICPNNYKGLRCEQNMINYCANVTCDNNSTCHKLLDDFQCNCSSYWSGKTCDVDVNECAKHKCQNSKSCTNTAGSYSCSCDTGWRGQDCQSDVDECAESDICNHAGFCINLMGTFQCVCNNGYSGDVCQHKTNFCTNETCNHHGQCKDGVAGYTCDCDEGWEGKECQDDGEECERSYCHYQVYCANLQKCICPKGFQGDECETDINECLSRPCHGNGNCTNFDGGYECNCFNGFTGSHCEVFINPCASYKCANGGTCHVAKDQATCICSGAWTGQTCENDVNECNNSPCKNSATCINTNGSFSCACPTGWTGSLCDIDINECITTSCKNNGICSNTPGSFKCSCQSEWQGQFCEVHRLCYNNPCKNSATCINTNGSFSCSCPTGWTGLLCDVDINECITASCKSNGVCINTNGSFSCLCPTGWTGSLCDIDINECITMGCKNKGVCSNTPGSFKCACQSEWQGQFCEVQRLSALTGEMIDMQFSKNISKAIQQQVISSLFNFIEKFSCQGHDVKLFISSMAGNTIQFISTCAGNSLSLDTIQNALRNISGPKMAQLFPVPFQGVQQSQTQQTTQTPSSNTPPWINDHWPIIVGCLGAAVIITVVVVIGYMRDKRLKSKDSDGYTNPVFSADYTSYS